MADPNFSTGLNQGSGGINNTYDLQQTSNQQAQGGTVASQSGTATGVTGGAGSTINVDLTSDEAIRANEQAYEVFANRSTQLAQGTIDTASQLAHDVGQAIVNKSETTAQTIERGIAFAIGAVALVIIGVKFFNRGAANG